MPLLRTDQLPPENNLVAQLDNLGFDGEKIFIITSLQNLVFIEKSRRAVNGTGKSPEDGVYQTEFPKAAAKWIAETIENKFWRSAAYGGLPSGVFHYEDTVSGENLKIRREMNVGAFGQKGFALINFSRPHLKYDYENYQETHITDLLLIDGGLLDLLKSI